MAWSLALFDGDWTAEDAFPTVNGWDEAPAGAELGAGPERGADTTCFLASPTAYAKRPLILRADSAERMG